MEWQEKLHSLGGSTTILTSQANKEVLPGDSPYGSVLYLGSTESSPQAQEMPFAQDVCDPLTQPKTQRREVAGAVTGFSDMLEEAARLLVGKAAFI